MTGANKEEDIDEAAPALPKPGPKPDQITGVIGEVGKYQLLKILLVFMASAPGLSHIFNAAFIAPKVKYWCNVAEANEYDESGNLLKTYKYDPNDFNITDDIGNAIHKYDTDTVYPSHSKFEVDPDNNETYIKVYPNTTSYKKDKKQYNPACKLHSVTGVEPQDKTNETKTTCLEFGYDHSFWESTIITEYDLVCEKGALPYVGKMVIFSGLAFGSFVSGLVSDRFGRKKAIWFTSLTMLAAGIITSIAPWYAMFIVFWWITGTSAIACYTAAFVWTMELTTGKWKIYLGMGMNYSWPFCRLIIAALTYGIREWRWVMRGISALVAFGSVILFWLPESPRWLIAKGRIPEAQKILSDCRKFNGNPIEPEKIELRKPAAAAAQGSFWQIFTHPILRVQTLILYFNWFTTALIMYGIALSWKELTGGLYLQFVIGTILDFPAKTLAMVLCLKGGRKLPYMLGSGITGTMFLITIFMPRDVDYLPGNWHIVTLALIGNFCTTMCFAVLYMYTGELMPTTVRAAGVGSSSLVSKVGGMLSTTVAALAEVHIAIPNVLFASLALTSAFLTFLLPETKGRRMPESLDDVDRNRFFESDPWASCRGLGKRK